MTGFENHRGGTVLGPAAPPLARVICGAGNRAGDGIDGAVQGSVIATYLHGPCLARNPELADLLLSRVVGELAPLEIDEVALLRRERLAASRRASSSLVGRQPRESNAARARSTISARPVLLDHLIDNPAQTLWPCAATRMSLMYCLRSVRC